MLHVNEIADYLYCHRAWWLNRVAQVRPFNSSAMEMGIARHLAYGREARRVETLVRLALVFIGLAAFFTTMWFFAVLLLAE